MVAVVARPPFEHHKNNFITSKLLFFVFKPTAHDALTEDLSKIQLIKFYEEVTGLFLSINPENRPGNESRRKI